jgi:hypothetical protein
MIMFSLMEQRIFNFSLIIGGTTEKVLQFIMPLKAVYNSFIEQKCVFEHCGKVKTRKDL